MEILIDVLIIVIYRFSENGFMNWKMEFIILGFDMRRLIFVVMMLSVKFMFFFFLDVMDIVFILNVVF